MYVKVKAMEYEYKKKPETCVDHQTDKSAIREMPGMEFPLLGFSVLPKGASMQSIDLETELFGLNKKYDCKKSEYKV